MKRATHLLGGWRKFRDFKSIKGARTRGKMQPILDEQNRDFANHEKKVQERMGKNTKALGPIKAPTPKICILLTWKSASSGMGEKTSEEKKKRQGGWFPLI